MDPKKVFTGNAAFLADMKFEGDLKKEDADYKQMYLTLFNGITYALSQIKRMNFGRARDILIDAQQEAEEIYISGAEDIRLEEEKTEE